MIDFDVYCPSAKVEIFMHQLKVQLNKDHPATKVYISTVNQDNCLIKKFYEFYNNTNLMEESK